MSIDVSNIAVSAVFRHPLGSGAAYTEAGPDHGDHDGFFSAQDFGSEFDSTSHGVEYHLGEDWNGDVGGDNDAGFTVSAASNGRVIYAGLAKDATGHVIGGWGGVVIIAHRLADNSFVSTLYGHLALVGENIDLGNGATLSPGKDVALGEKIGILAHGADFSLAGFPENSHLHFEVRVGVNDAIGIGYSSAPRPAGWLDPTDFINAHRTATPTLPDLEIDNLTPLNATTKVGSVIALGAVVHNYGGVTAGAFSTRVYISPHSTFDTNAIPLATFSTSSLAINAVVNLNQSVTVPNLLATGPYYLIVVADYLNQVTDLDRNNNSFSIPITVQPALAEPKSTLPVSLGGTATIGHGFLWSYDTDEATGGYGDPADITYTVGTPAHGTVLKNGVATNAFTQADIDSGLIQYRQNGDAVARDGFTFTVTDLAGNQLTEYFSIAVVAGPGPVVDTNKDLHVTAAGSALLDLSLSTVALGNQPGELRYTVISAPAHGVLYNRGIAASSFTQADIDDYLVQYRQNGDPGTSDSFTFSVTDRNGNQTAVQTFNIAVAPASAPVTGTRTVDHDDIGAVVSDGATLVVQPGGSAAASVVEKGGTEIIQSGARAYATIVTGGAQLVQSGGASNGAIVDNGGLQQIAAGGIDNRATIGHGGLQVDAGTSRQATLDGGTQVVQDGGASFGTVVDSGGVQAIASGGVATGTVVNSGGQAVVHSGGTLNGATIDGGLIEITRDGSVGPAAVTFAGTGGVLRLDAASQFAGTAAGLGFGNYLDLADVAYREGQTLDYSPNSDNGGGSLSVGHGSGAVALALLGQYIASGFHEASDGAGGTVITYADPESHPAGNLFLALPHSG